jgi:hypothetical protein
VKTNKPWLNINLKFYKNINNKFSMFKKYWLFNLGDFESVKGQFETICKLYSLLLRKIFFVQIVESLNNF